MVLLMAEIRRSPVEVGSLSQYFEKVLYIPGGFLAGFLPSTVARGVYIEKPRRNTLAKSSDNSVIMVMLMII